MAKLITQINSLKIEETEPQDDTAKKYLITTLDGNPKWEFDTLEEAVDYALEIYGNL